MIDSNSMDNANTSVGIFWDLSITLVTVLVMVDVTGFVRVSVSFRVLVNVIVDFCVIVSVSVFVVSTCWVTVVA